MIHVYVSGGPISWCSKKKLVVTLSTCEAKYIVVNLSACRAIWLMNLLQELKFKVSKSVKLMIDNKYVISIAKNPVLHGRSKYIDIKYHFLLNQVQNGVLKVVHVSTQKQLINVMTKEIKTEHFINLRGEIGVVDFNLNTN